MSLIMWISGRLRYILRSWRYKFRIQYYKYKGLRIGEDVEIRRHVYFDNYSRVSIGSGSFVNRGCQFHTGGGSESRIVLGDRVFVGMNVCFLTVSHEIGSSSQRAAVNKYKSIIIEDGCWIGANATILPGVTIGKGTVVAAGAVVTKSAPANTLLGGVPAGVIKDLPDC